MPYMTGGVYIDGKAPKTKSALKQAIADDPQRVRFYSTSALSARSSFTLDTLPQGQPLSICGPDPHQKRSWYATVQRLSTGKLHCS